MGSIWQEHIGKGAPYLSWPWVWRVTPFPKARAEPCYQALSDYGVLSGCQISG